MDVLKTLPDASVDSIVTDPPYHLTTGKKGGSGPASVNLESPHGRARIGTGFMGMKWDGGDIAFRPEVWIECLRVLKPGGYLLAFGGTRTYHRLVCAIEDAGFEIRDQIGWAYGSGFPKSLDVSKAIDKAAGVERDVVGPNPNHRAVSGVEYEGVYAGGNTGGANITAPATDAARQWQGWGTALKPAWEPIVMARKPLIGTVAANVLAHGTGALNIDGCRVGTDGGSTIPSGMDRFNASNAAQGYRPAVYAQGTPDAPAPAGRWPANICHDGSEEVLAAFPETTSGGGPKPGTPRVKANTYGEPTVSKSAEYGNNTGSAARFFYCAKASRADRNEGCESMPKRPLNWSSGTQSPGTFQAEGTDRSAHNAHPTVKPTDLMRYLCRLVTPKGGTVLDPFMGSGSTLKAAELEGFNSIGIELSEEYAEIARRRIGADAPLFSEVTS
jgi:site-specific DNA-methyltransferase (adenine-specific)